MIAIGFEFIQLIDPFLGESLMCKLSLVINLFWYY